MTGLRLTFVSNQAIMSTENIFTGITQLDEATGGFRPGELIVISGRPAMGKTALGLSMLTNEKTTTRFLYLSLQETIHQLNPRFKKMTGWTTGDGPLCCYEDNTAAYDTEHKRHVILYKECPSMLDIQESISNQDIRSFDVVIIDSLYQIGKKPKTLFGKKNHNSIFRQLKSIAKLILRPIIVLAGAERIIEKKPLKGIPFQKLYSRIKYVDFLYHLYRWEYYGLDWDDWEDRSVTGGDAMLVRLLHKRDTSRIINPRIHYDMKTMRFE